MTTTLAFLGEFGDAIEFIFHGRDHRARAPTWAARSSST